MSELKEQLNTLARSFAETKLLHDSNIITATVQGDAVVVNTAVDVGSLDRQTEETAAAAVVESYDMKDPFEKTGADYSNFQEAQRIRRDLNMIRTGHKRLVMGALETVYRNTIMLDATLNGN